MGIDERLNDIEYQLRKVVIKLDNLATDKKEQDYEQPYYTLREAVELKFGPKAPYSTIQTNPYRMPGCNTGYKIIAGVKRWPASIVKLWVNSDDRDAYNFCIQNNIPLVGRNGEKLKKYAKEK